MFPVANQEGCVPDSLSVLSECLETEVKFTSSWTDYSQYDFRYIPCIQYDFLGTFPVHVGCGCWRTWEYITSRA